MKIETTPGEVALMNFSSAPAPFVLGELGLTTAEIASLRQARVV